MASEPRMTLYPIAECFRVDTSGTDAVDIWNIPKGTIIERVVAKIAVAGTGAGNLTIGDDDSGNGFVTAADATAAADTLYGDDHTELGSYLYDGTKKFGLQKWYTAANKELKMDCSAALTTEATVDVFVWGYRYNED